MCSLQTKNGSELSEQKLFYTPLLFCYPSGAREIYSTHTTSLGVQYKFYFCFPSLCTAVVHNSCLKLIKHQFYVIKFSDET